MNIDFIKNIIVLEELHRYCFDNLYVQNHEITKEELAILYKYKILYKEYPNFRQNCAEATLFLFNDKNIIPEKTNLLEKLRKINFNRYSIDKDIKETLKTL